MLGAKSQIEDNKHFDPVYWHMTGDSFPSLPAVNEKQQKIDNVSKIKLKLQDIQDAQLRINGEILQTPLLAAKNIGKKKYNLFFKCENLQYTGSFKARGACNVLASLSPSQRCKGCVTAGGRNFLMAMTLYAHRQTIPLNVVVPKDCPITDKHLYKENFALVKVHGNDANEASLRALTYCDEIGCSYIHGSDRLDLIAGYGTVGLEILSQLDKLDAIICPVGSGNLIAGIIIAVKTLKPNCLIYGVECSACPVMSKALEQKKPVMGQMNASIADSLSSLIASNNAFHVIRRYCDRMITVDETYISGAMISLMEREKMLVEGAGACGVATIMAEKVPELMGKNVVCILTGSNINSSRMSRAIDRGLAAQGRLLKVMVTLPDVPGVLAALLAKMCEVGVDIRSLVPEHTWMKRDIYTTSVTMIVETCDVNHSNELQKKIMKDYPQAHFIGL